MTEEKKGITVKIDAELHAEVRQYLDSHGITMAEFVTLALQDELHPKLNIQEDKNMGNMRTMAFQVPEKLFQKIKDYLQCNNMTQKQFVIGLIENEIERDLAQRAAMSEAPTDFEEVTESSTKKHTETAAVDDCESLSGDESEEFEDEELNNGEAEDLDDEQDEYEDQGMSMGM